MTTVHQNAMTDNSEVRRNNHICPVWVGYLLLSPLRKLLENPDTILSPLVVPGMKAVDIGCAMGYFSLPLARMVGDNGRVVCLDVQEKMLRNLETRAHRRNLDHIIETRKATPSDLALSDLKGTVDLALAIHVLHETAYPRRFLGQIHESLRPGGKLLIIEPKGHVSNRQFDISRQQALEIGFSELENHLHTRSRSMVLQA